MDTYAALNEPGVGIFTMIIIGLLAGWIAERVTDSDHGLLTNLLFGLIGAFVGGKLAEFAEIPVFGFFRTLIAATIGAIIVLFLWRRLRSR
ncbi:GlsB/YeaQ/YmgE family stress response membrane protein [Ancylobacter terrae]|uniref:GlsB/YeaQ/YmgE family stress response membrane protein n=1 Tax=Ancylobacter sp. sgz301288 TaxID=3342077 RepID=UPI00385CC3CA